jgi:DNA-directed RNA polymerase specialized sigma24 family protein
VGASGPSEATDDALIRASLEQPEVFGQLYDRHATVVHRYLTSRVGVESADDLLSEVFVTAFRCRTSYDVKITDAVPWLLGIATKVVRHHRRSEGRRSALQRRLDQAGNRHGATDVGDFATDIVGHADFEDVRRAVEQLDVG